MVIITIKITLLYRSERNPKETAERYVTGDSGDGGDDGGGGGDNGDDGDDDDDDDDVVEII